MSMSTKKYSVDVERLFIGSEPEWGNKNELSVPRALSWYANQQDAKDSKKYTIDFAKSNKFDKTVINALSEADESLFKNLGFVCRMTQRGAELNKSDWILERINEIVQFDINVIKVSQFSGQTKVEKTVQEKLYDVCSLYISEIEDYIDLFIKTKLPIDFNPYDWMLGKSVKSPHAKQIKEHFIPLIDELNLVQAKKDEDLVEGYSNFTKKQLNQFIELVNLVINDCDKIIGNSKVTRKTRKKKVVSDDKKIAKVQYKKEDVEHKLVSISPIDIIGAKELWVYNTKYKQLGLYKSEDDSGFGIKGTTIIGFDSTSSIQKKLRKPLEILDQFKKAKKVELRKFLSTISTKESSLNGRLNSEIILLKVSK